MIERRILIGLITNSEFIQRIRDKWDIRLLESNAARRIASWCIEYYDKYTKAPNRDIEGVFYQKLKEAKNFPKDLAEEIEQEILPSLSEQYIEENAVNCDYLVDETNKYFNERRLLLYSDQIKSLISSGKLIEAEKFVAEYHTPPENTKSWIDLGHTEVLERIDRAFNRTNEVLIAFPGAIGELWNEQLVRGAFVAFMSPEKRGKTFILLEMAERAAKKKLRVAFFQAGDMTEEQQLMRICVYHTRKSNKKRYCGMQYTPVKDCIYNQIDSCPRKERECDFGIFHGRTESELKKVKLEELIEAFEENPEYRTCTNCSDYDSNKWGTAFIKLEDVGKELTNEEAKEAIDNFFIRYKREFRLSTHANSTLSVNEIQNILDLWQRQDNFTPDVIIIDYADLLIDDSVNEFRHKQNEIWKSLRGLSQERHCLLITATQADAASYAKDLLRLENYSEDKRKYAHVTAMYGLNQDKDGREKEIGIMRVNELVVREGDFNSQHQVHLLQNLARGRPFLTSYW